MKIQIAPKNEAGFLALLNAQIESNPDATKSRTVAINAALELFLELPSKQQREAFSERLVTSQAKRKTKVKRFQMLFDPENPRHMAAAEKLLAELQKSRETEPKLAPAAQNP